MSPNNEAPQRQPGRGDAASTHSLDASSVTHQKRPVKFPLESDCEIDLLALVVVDNAEMTRVRAIIGDGTGHFRLPECLRCWRYIVALAGRGRGINKSTLEQAFADENDAAAAMFMLDRLVSRAAGLKMASAAERNALIERVSLEALRARFRPNSPAKSVNSSPSELVRPIGTSPFSPVTKNQSSRKKQLERTPNVNREIERRKRMPPLNGSESEAVELAIFETQPANEESRNSRALLLASRLKAIEKLASLPAVVLRPVVRRWFELALPRIGPQAFDATWDDFSTAWLIARPYGHQWDAALEKARSQPDPLALSIASTLGYENHSGFITFVALICELDRFHDGGEFPLPVEKSGEAVGVVKDTTSRWLKILIGNGFLTLTKPEDVGQHRARFYRLHRNVPDQPPPT